MFREDVREPFALAVPTGPERAPGGWGRKGGRVPATSPLKGGKRRPRTTRIGWSPTRPPARVGPQEQLRGSADRIVLGGDHEGVAEVEGRASIAPPRSLSGPSRRRSGRGSSRRQVGPTTYRHAFFPRPPARRLPGSSRAWGTFRMDCMSRAPMFTPFQRPGGRPTRQFVLAVAGT